MKYGTAVLAAFTLSACTPSLPEVFNIKKFEVIDSPQELVWDRLIRHFAVNNIQIKTIDRLSGVVYAEKQFATPTIEWEGRGKIGELADCGKSYTEIPFLDQLEMNVYVKALGAKTEVTVTTSFKQVFQPGGLRAQADCNSTGRLEREILDAMAARPKR
jgi:hypothetical protein